MKHLLLLIALFSSPVFAGNVNIDNLDPGKDVVIRTTNSAGVKQEVTRFSPPLGNGVRSVGTVGSAPQLATYGALVATDFPGSASDVSWFSLDTNGNDGSANARNLTASAVSFFTKGWFGREAVGSFNSSSSYYESSNAFYTLNGLTAWTIGGWVYIYDAVPSSIALVNKWGSSQTQFRIHMTTSNGCSLKTETSTNGTSATAGANPGSCSSLVGKWAHFAVTFSGTTLKHYLNGQLETTNTGWDSTVFNSTANFRIGQDAATAHSARYPMQDVFFLKNNAMTDSQVNAIYSKRFKGAQPQIAAGHTLSPSSFPLTSLTGKVAYWNFDSTADGSGNSVTFTNNGSTPFTGLGLTGTANTAVLDGTTQYFNTTNSFFNFSKRVTQYAVGGWFNATDWTPASAVQFFVFTDDGNPNGNDFYLNTAGALTFEGQAGSGSYSPPVPLVDGSWHHVMLVHDGANLRLYVDGVVAGTSITSANLGTATTTNSLIVGRYTTAVRFWKGRISNFFAIKNVVLSSADIRKIYLAKATHNKAITPEQQYWQASWLREDGKVAIPLENSWIIDMNSNDLFMDFSNLSPGDQVFIRSK